MNQAPGPAPNRRSFLAQSLAAAGLFELTPAGVVAAPSLLVGNVTALYAVEVARIEAPSSALKVAALVKSWPGRIAVGGGRYSMGGQVAIASGLHLDMRQMNQLVWLRPGDRTARVQAGMRWRDLQDHLDPLDLAVKTMQSYSNFTIGGSVSVNAHGRYVNHGPVGNTVRALQLVLADGAIVEASPVLNEALFRAAIGGYGAVGIITEVELDLASNVRIERSIENISLEGYVEHFNKRVLHDATAVLHSADLMPPSFDRPASVTWRKAAGKPLTDTERLVARGRSYGMEQNAMWAMTELPGGRKLRESVGQPVYMATPAVKWLNCEASLDVAQLEPRTRRFSTYALQEYFIPPRHFLPFARGIAKVLRTNNVEALNLSIRHSPADRVSLMPWAREEVFSFVLFYKQRTHEAAQHAVGRWTRELIDLALAYEGRYYLPYQLHGTQAQFERAYPEAEQLRRVKQGTDPSGKLSNELWKKYL